MGQLRACYTASDRSPGVQPAPRAVRSCGAQPTVLRGLGEPDAHQAAGNLWVQVLHGPGRLRLRRGHHRGARPQRLRQVERRRRHPLGDGRAVGQAPSRPVDGGRDLQRQRDEGPAVDGRGDDHLLQRQPPALAGAVPGVRRHLGDPPPVSQRRLRVRHQQGALPPARRDRAVPGHRGGHQGLLDHRAGPHRPHRLGQARGPALAHRGGRGHHALQEPPQGGRAQDGLHRAEPGAGRGHRRRARQAARQPQPPGAQGREVQAAQGRDARDRAAHRDPALPRAERARPRRPRVGRRPRGRGARAGRAGAGRGRAPRRDPPRRASSGCATSSPTTRRRSPS